MNGEAAVCPVSTDLRLWLLSPRGAIVSLIAGHELAGEAFGASRTVNLPGLSVSVGEMIAALEQVAGSEVTKRISYAPDPAVERIVKSWPGAWDTARAEALGLTADADFAGIIRAYIDDVKAAG
ncbi:hypothetical protein D3C85_1112150 [compost metagenome]